MKKESKGFLKILIPAVAVLAVAGVAVAAVLLAKNPTELTGTDSPLQAEPDNVTDISWYDNNADEFVITDAKTLSEFAQLSYYYDFEGKTVKLGADISLNAGDASDWEKDAPEIFWTPIANFAGTFDGQGHTVSGIYAKTYLAPTAMFVDAKSTALIENFRIENSLFLTTGQRGSASVAAASSGTFRRIYSNASVRCEFGYAGGLFSRQSGNLTAEECWFDGEVETSYKNVGGIADCAFEAELALNHCLNTGKIICTYADGAGNAGGIAGMTMNGGRLMITDCFSAGTMNLANPYRSGSVLGGGDSKSSVSFSNTFCSLGMYELTVSDNVSNIVGGAAPIDEKNLLGAGAYQWTNLDFDNYWNCREGDFPALRYFCDNPMDLSGTARMVDYSWYDESAEELVIMNADQLYSFALNSYNTDYAGKTVKLGADITLNTGDAEKWIENAPEMLWYPVQWFGGTFDGQGHTISGVYVVGNTAQGFFSRAKGTAAIKNFRLENSLIHAKAAGLINTGIALSGAVVGRGGGLFDSIYTNAIVYAEGNEIGGIIGQVNLKGMITVISNCWFDGKLICKGEERGYQAGGIIGGHVLGTVNMTHCLSTGTIHTEVKKGSGAGGLVGVVMNEGTILNIGDCLSAAKYETANPYYVGAGVGVAYGKTSVSFNKTFALRESVVDAMGRYASHNGAGNSFTAINTSGAVLPVFRENLTGASAARWTDLNFDKFWSLRKGDIPVLTTFYNGETLAADTSEKIFSIDWYTPGEGGTIKSKKDYIGFTMLSYGTYFTGETVSLGSGISLGGTRTVPVMSFDGTFNGHGHTISGLYQREKEAAGMFSVTTAASVIKNFSLKNSTIEVTGLKDKNSGNVLGLSGSVVGRGGGHLSSIYSNATIRSRGMETGGIIGQINQKGNNSFSDIWFDGKILGIGSEYGYFAGGIAGGVMMGNNSFSHCLFTGSITTDVSNKGSKVGGIIGSVQNKSNATVTDCLSVGVLMCGNPYYKGAIMGTMYSGSTVKISNCFADSQVAISVSGAFVSAAKNEFVKENELIGAAVPIASEKIKDVNAYRWTTLEFGKHWSVRKDDYPALKAFVGSGISTKSVKKMVDTSWYKSNEKTLTIDSMEDLYGMQILSYTTDFSGKTIKLAKNIVINQGNASNWAKKAPENEWSKIGKFAGTLDGQGHSISGMYINGGTENTVAFIGTLNGGTIKNLRLTNSFITGEGHDIAALAGTSNGGIIEKVYTDAIIRPAGKTNIGGFIGSARGESHTIFRECRFDGDIYRESDENGGQMGGFVGTIVNAGSSVTVENCLMSGSVGSNTQMAVGGIAATAFQDGAALNVKDTLISGSVTSGGGGQTGAFVGTAKVLTLNVTNGYAVSDNNIAVIGAGSAAKGKARFLTKELLSGTRGYQNTNLDFKRYWSAVNNDTPVLTSFYSGKALSLSGVLRPDTSWYSDSKSEFVISTKSELLGFALLSGSNDFAKKTVKLGADIDLNPGWSAGSTAPDELWMRIGTFAGTFDGQGHKVSGVYVKASSGNDIGFISVIKGGTVKNLRLENSYFEGGTASNGVGGIAGTVTDGGKLDTVYCRATVVGNYYNNGGIVGRANGNGTLKITNSQFDGTVTNGGATSYAFGGILGSSVNDDTKVTVENCLMSGTVSINVMRAAGGIIGERMNGSIVSVSRSLVSGSIVSAGGGQTGAVIGKIGSGTLSLTDVYATSESCAAGSNGIGLGTPEGSAVTMAAEQLRGTKGYKNTELDFDTYWSAVEGETPVLTSFSTGTALDLTGVTKPDKSWYDDSASEFVISTKSELLGFAQLTGSKNFSGKTVKLGADIDLNPGWSAGSTAPEEPWQKTGTFAGTLDGQGHKISGIYIKVSSGNDVGFISVLKGGMIKNLRLENSYVESGTNSNGTGGLVGTVTDGGVIDTVYCRVAVVGNYYNNGGIVGRANGDGTLTITNTQFDGTVRNGGSTAYNFGGILGASINDGTVVNINNCLMTGAVSVDIMRATGGILGERMNASTVSIADSLVTGSISSTGGGQTGAVAGKVVNNKASMSRVYATSESCSVGTNGIGLGTPDGAASVIATAQLRGIKGYTNTELDFENYWSAVDGKTPVLTSFFDGTAIDLTGVGRDEIIIANAEDLVSFANDSKGNTFSGKTAKLIDDIDLTSVSAFPMIGSIGSMFAGTFDGQGHTITGLTISSTVQYTGLFAATDGALIKDFTLTNSTFTGTKNELGAVAGYITGSTVVSDVVVADTVSVSGTGGIYIGGIVGRIAKNSVIKDCECNASVSGTSHSVGGAAGCADLVGDPGIRIADTRIGATVSSSGKQCVGGIVGRVYANANPTLTISGCVFSGSVTGGDNTGGIIGGRLSFNTGTGTGLVTVRDCIVTGNVAGERQVGGVIGRTSFATVISCTTVTGNVTSSGAYDSSDGTACRGTGGIIGKVDNPTGSGYSAYTVSITDCYVDGTITSAGGRSGGIVGYTNAKNVTLQFKGCVFTGTVGKAGTYCNGGILGALHNTGLITLSFEDCISVGTVLGGNTGAIAGQVANAVAIPVTRCIFTGSKWTVMSGTPTETDLQTTNISNAIELINVAKASKKTNFAGTTLKLAADIDMKEVADYPMIGDETHAYAGTFDGQNHTVSNLTPAVGSKYGGLFKTIDTGAVIVKYPVEE